MACLIVYNAIVGDCRASNSLLVCRSDPYRARSIPKSKRDFPVCRPALLFWRWFGRFFDLLVISLIEIIIAGKEGRIVFKIHGSFLFTRFSYISPFMD